VGMIAMQTIHTCRHSAKLLPILIAIKEIGEYVFIK
jgi:hypothetical protein